MTVCQCAADQVREPERLGHVAGVGEPFERGSGLAWIGAVYLIYKMSADVDRSRAAQDGQTSVGPRQSLRSAFHRRQARQLAHHGHARPPQRPRQPREVDDVETPERDSVEEHQVNLRKELTFRK